MFITRVHAQDAKQHPGVFSPSEPVDVFDMLAVYDRRQQSRTSCKSGTEDAAQTNRRALLLALVAAPGIAQLQPAHAGGNPKTLFCLEGIG